MIPIYYDIEIIDSIFMNDFRFDAEILLVIFLDRIKPTLKIRNNQINFDIPTISTIFQDIFEFSCIDKVRLFLQHIHPYISLNRISNSIPDQDIPQIDFQEAENHYDNADLCPIIIQ